MPGAEEAKQVIPDRKVAVRADVMRRLRPACTQLPEEEFLGLVELMVERQLKYERAK
jgi:hypothetical protein